MGVTHNSINIDEAGDALTRTKSGVNLPLLYPSAVQKDYIPGFNFAGTNITSAFAPNFTSVGDAPFVNYNTVINISDNLTRIVGSHAIKTGVFLERSRKNQSSFGNNNGFYNFGDTTANPFDTGFGFANAATGVYQTMDQAVNLHQRRVSLLERGGFCSGHVEGYPAAYPRLRTSPGLVPASV
jgi:hypothetical protein